MILYCNYTHSVFSEERQLTFLCSCSHKLKIHVHIAFDNTTRRFYTQPVLAAVHKNGRKGASASVSVSFKMEPQLKYVVVELAAKSALVRVLPFTVHNLEGNVLIGGSRMKPQN